MDLSCHSAGEIARHSIHEWLLCMLTLAVGLQQNAQHQQMLAYRQPKKLETTVKTIKTMVISAKYTDNLLY